MSAAQDLEAFRAMRLGASEAGGPSVADHPAFELLCRQMDYADEHDPTFDPDVFEKHLEMAWRMFAEVNRKRSEQAAVIFRPPREYWGTFEPVAHTTPDVAVIHDAPPTPAFIVAWRALQGGALIAVLVMAAAALFAPVAPAITISGAYLGAAVYFLSQYGGASFGAKTILWRRISLIGFYGSVGLVVTAIIAAAT